MAFSIVKNVFDGLSGNASKKATNQAIAASSDATDKIIANANQTAADNKATLAPFVAQGGPATSYINGLLGIGTPQQTAQAEAGYDAYKKSGGYLARLNEGTRAITNNQAVNGLLNSGSTLKALTKFGQDYATNDRNTYINQLAGQQSVGLSAAGAQAGVATTASGQVQGAIGTNATNIGNAALSRAAATNATTSSLIGAGATIAGASDPRLKLNIVRHGTRPDGLGDYSWNYVPELHAVYGPDRWRGVMADEVAVLCPEKLGPVIAGFATVRYDLLEPA